MLMMQWQTKAESLMHSNFDSKRQSDRLAELHSNSSSISGRIVIPALPPLSTSPAAAATSGSSSGIYSLFSSNSSSSSKLLSSSVPLSTTSSSSNQSYHGVLHPHPMEMPSTMTPMPSHPTQHHHHLHHNDPLEAVLGQFPCVRVRGLPHNASIQDVLVFFQGLVILDVLVVPDSYGQQGQGSQQAFVLFANPMDFDMALQRNRQPMGSRYIEVFQGKRSDYYTAVASQFNQPRVEMGEGGEMHQQGGPWAPGGNPLPQTQGLMAQQQMMQKGLHPGTNKPYTTGIGGNAQDFGGQQGSSTKFSGNAGRPGRAEAGGSGGGGRSKRGSGRGGGIQVGEHTGYLRMRGLPFTAAKTDIATFFSAYDPIEDSIALTYRSDGP